MNMKKKFRSIVIYSIILAIMCGLGCLVYFRAKEDLGSRVVFAETFAGKTGYQSTTLGTVDRRIPTTTADEGMSTRYPTYGTSISAVTDEEKSGLISESTYLKASSTTYDSMDADGHLYLNGADTGRVLYKHTSSVGMYLGDVSDDQPAVVQRITITPTELRNYITGLYAPAGEVVKIEISSEDLTAIGGSLTVAVGQVSHRNNQNNIWTARNDFSRMPWIANIMTMDTTTAYVGNFLGGPIYLYPSALSTFTVTITGAVKYAYYCHGYTTRAEVEEMATYSAPYYDFEVFDLGVRHSGPSAYGNYDYDNLVKVGDLWEKICMTSRQVPCSANATIGVGYVYDCFVAAGAACAFQGGHSWINAPCSWLSGALNYDSMVTDGFWGIIHEFNHLYQSYGMYGTKTNEVTNNATSLLSYVLYTNISAKRSEDINTLSWWNRYTDPSFSLKQTLSYAESGDAQLALNCYADIIHSFGTDVYTLATRTQTALGVDGWYSALTIATGYNMTYYFEELLHQTLSDDVKALYDDPSLPTYVPVASLYQTGRDYLVGKKRVAIETVRPYEIESGDSLTLDFDEQLVVPSGFRARIVKVTRPQNGTLTKTGDKVYVYTPDEHEYSGTFYVTVRLSHPTITTPDVVLSINIRQRVGESEFTSETRYARSYSASEVLEQSDLALQSIVSVNHGRWGDGVIDNILDGDPNTFYHNDSGNFVSEGNPFELVVDLGKQMTCNTITITSRTSNQYNLPCTFALYGGDTAECTTLLGTYTDLALSGNTVTATFAPASIRYYRLYVTDSKSQSAGNKYITISRIDLTYSFAGEEYSPLALEYYAQGKEIFERVRGVGSFGFAIRGNGSIKYTFSGRGIVIKACQDTECKLKVTIDGQSTTVTLSADDATAVAYVKDNLKNKKHDITIRVLSGTLCVDSVIIR